MHHSVEMSVPQAASDDVLHALAELDGVLSLYVERGVGVKPEGDVITAHVLNRSVDGSLPRRNDTVRSPW